MRWGGRRRVRIGRNKVTEMTTMMEEAMKETEEYEEDEEKAAMLRRNIAQEGAVMVLEVT